MIIKNLIIKNKLGLHARASAKFVALALKFLSNIEVKTENKTVNGKSIMGIMSLAAGYGNNITLSINGDDELHMAEALTNLINNKFDEQE